MKEFLRGWKFKILVCIFALFLGFMIYAAMAAGAASLPELALRTITEPFARLSSGISSRVEDGLDKLINADKYKRENEELREKISELNRRNINIEELEKDNELLREMLDIVTENPEIKMSDICTISARNFNDVFGGFTIDRGANDGISFRDMVVTKIGAVGIITEVAPNYSKVSTILHANVKIGVRTTRANTIGIIENDILYAKDGYCLVSYIEKDADIAVGDIFVTAGTEDYPANYIIGEVVDVFGDANGLTLRALIRPSEHLSRITDVFVIIDFTGKGKPLNE
ncbi:MAG: rod shape-determining protein MreC [Oscillospiraceae bacterium]|nr:rod shape-determining protein MreC [Oscillospiraceae bacterium]